ncbi:MAG: hypothetical protein CVU89_10925 [Firmicutes bacterium HGW-Firmicutes-14]|jgi:signal transduction histidine kinase|nr:MAG: hypothetical protein CVU89_10925 [Firmicutes bacterium HGW-Firmicutes-14]
MEDILIGMEFLYGLSFYSMGLAIAMQYRSYSTFRLAHSVSFLAAFGILHGLSDWGNIFIPFQIPDVGQESIWKLIALQRLVEGISFLSLFIFGAKLVTDTWGSHRRLLFIPVSIFSLWLGIYLIFIFKIGTPELLVWLNVSEVWARYLMALPGGLLAAFALVLQIKELRVIETGSLVSSLRIALGAFIFFGIFDGLVVPEAPFFPANVINEDLIYNHTGIRVELLRAFTGFIVTFFFTRILAVFDIEKQRRLDASYRRQGVLLERERFGRDLHDDVLQSLFGIGISIQSAGEDAKKILPELGKQMEISSKRLGDVVQNIRNYIIGLQPELDTNLNDFFRENIARLKNDYQLSIDYFCDSKLDLTRVNSDVANHLSKIFLEGTYNVIQHADASRIWVALGLTNKNHLFMSLKDNGKGFVLSEVMSCNPRDFYFCGNGLPNMEARTRLLNGEFRIKSISGLGTEIIISLPDWAICPD